MSLWKIITGKELGGKFTEFALKMGKSEGQLLAVNHKFIAASWEGAFYQISILDKNNPHKVASKLPLIRGHREPITDLHWSPFYSDLLASSSEDGTVKFWKIPDDGIKEDITNETQKFHEHPRKVLLFRFHPSSSDIAGSCGLDKTIKVWSVLKGKGIFSMSTSDSLTSLDWNYNGSLIGGMSKDKFANVFDPRTQKEVIRIKGSNGARPQKLVFVGPDNFITTGFGSTNREIKLFDLRNSNSSVSSLNIDQDTSLMYPFFDYDTNIIYIPSKCSKVYFYTFMNGKISILRSAHVLPDRCQEFTFEDKRFVDLNSNEMTRMYWFYKNALHFTSFYVPRKSGEFDSNLYPDTFSGESAINEDEWINGTNKDQIKKPIKEIDKKGGHKSFEKNKIDIKSNGINKTDNKPLKINKIDKSQDIKNQGENFQEKSIEEKVKLLKLENNKLKVILKDKKKSNENLYQEVERLKLLIS